TGRDAGVAALRALHHAVATHRVAVDVGVEVAARGAAAVAREAAARDRAVRALGRAGLRAAHQKVGRACVAVIALRKGRARRRRIAGLARLDHPISAARLAVAIVVCVTACRAATIPARTRRDLRVGAGALATRAGHAVDGTSVAVVALGRALRAVAGLTGRNRRVAQLAALYHAVAAHRRHAVRILTGAAPARAAAVVGPAGRDDLMPAGSCAVGGAAEQRVGRARVAVVAAGRARRGRIARLAGLDHAVAAGGAAVWIVVRIAAGRAAGVVGAAGRDRIVLAARGAAGRAALHAVARAGVAVVATGRARRGRIAGLAHFDDPVSAGGPAVGVVGRVAARRAAAVVAPAGRG